METYSNDNYTSIEDNLVSCGHEEPYPIGQAIIRLYLIGPLTMAGMVANTLNLLVFSHKSMMISPINCFLLVLAASDFTALICTFFMLSFPVLAEKSHSEGAMYAAALLTRWLYPLSQTAQTGSVYLTVIVGVNRFLGVCHPLKARRWTSKKSGRWSIALVLIFGVVFNITRWMEVTNTPCWSTFTNDTSIKISASELRMNGHYMKWFMSWTYIIIMFALPFSILITVNALISRALHRSSLLRAGMKSQYRPIRQEDSDPASKQLVKDSDQQTNARKNAAKHSELEKSLQERDRHKKERSVTVMLLAVVGLFLVCNSLAFINNLLELVKLYYTSLHDNDIYLSIYLVLIEVGNFLVVTNCSSNVVIYWLCSSKYRQVVRLLCKQSKKTRGAFTAELVYSQISPPSPAAKLEPAKHTENIAINANNVLNIAI